MYNFSWFDITSLLLKFLEFYLERFAFLEKRAGMILLLLCPLPFFLLGLWMQCQGGSNHFVTVRTAI